MVDQPSGVTPTPGAPEYGRDKPKLGEGEEAQEPKPFSLGPEGGQAASPEGVATDKPTPMEVASEGAQAKMSPEQIGDQMNKLKTQLDSAQKDLQNPSVTGKLTEDHYQALGKLVEKMTPDMRAMAKNSGGEFNPPQRTAGEPILNYVTRWINGSQESLSSSLNYLSSQPKSPNPAAMLKLQYDVQRATQRGELFASIVGSSVSGIKTIMSTQLG